MVLFCLIIMCTNGSKTWIFFYLKSVISFISNVSLFNLLLISFSYQNQNQHLSTSFIFLIRTLQVFLGILGISVPYSYLFYNKNIFQNLMYLICSRIFYFRRKALGKKNYSLFWKYCFLFQNSFWLPCLPQTQ